MELEVVVALFAQQPYEFANYLKELNVYSVKELHRVIQKARRLYGDMTAAHSLEILKMEGLPV